jgi:hypothetical protein
MSHRTGPVVAAASPPETTKQPPPRASRGVRVDRVDRIPGLPPRRTVNGHIAIPLWALRGGRHIGDADLELSPSEAELLRDQLTVLLAERAPR